MALPPPVLRLLSGGEALEISGRILDPQMQMIAHAAKQAPKMADLSPQGGQGLRLGRLQSCRRAA